MNMKISALIVLVGLFAVGTTAYPSSLDRTDYEFEFHKWTSAFSREYKDLNEYIKRRNVFQRNLDFIVGHNSDETKNYRLGLNNFSDMSFTEWRQDYLGYRPELKTVKNKNRLVHETQTAVPDSVDWRQKGAVTPVKNQGQCGSCWSFSATGSMEGAHFIKTGELVSLSEQQLVDCSTSEGNHGCFGGLMDYAFTYVEQNGGIDTESDYPYFAKSGTCNTQKSHNDAAKFSSFVDVPQNNENALKSAVAQQPVSIAIEADQPAFQFYKSGIFDGACGTQLDHGVLAVGYGTENGTDYWLVKNSWGEIWGDQGYIKLARNIESPKGQCGIAMQPSYPVSS